MLERADNLLRPTRHSADLGPELFVPWRHPTLTVVYLDVAPESVATDLVPADASVIARHTSDATLLTPSLPAATAATNEPTQWSHHPTQSAGQGTRQLHTRDRVARIAQPVSGGCRCPRR